MSNQIEIKKNKSKYIVRVIDCNICCESKDITFFKKCNICKNAICESCYVNIFYNTEKCPYCRKLLDLDEVILELYYDFEDNKERKMKHCLYIFFFPLLILLFILFLNIGYLFRNIFSIPYEEVSLFKFSLETLIIFCEGVLSSFIFFISTYLFYKLKKKFFLNYLF